MNVIISKPCTWEGISSYAPRRTETRDLLEHLKWDSPSKKWPCSPKTKSWFSMFTVPQNCLFSPVPHIFRPLFPWKKLPLFPCSPKPLGGPQYTKKINFIFLKFMKVWTQRVTCKVSYRVNFARDPLRSYFHEPQKNEIHLLNLHFDFT